MSLRRSFISVSVTLALGGCVAHGQASEVPVVAPTPGAPAASSYPIPASDPRGSVNVMSFGPEHLAVAAGQPDSYLHMRLAVENRTDDVDWTVAATDQWLSAGGAPIPATFADSNSGGPVLTVAPHARGGLDLFFPLAGGIEPPRVSLDWRIQRGAQLVAQSTSFDRQPAQGAADVVYYAPAFVGGISIGVGPGWWYGGWGWHPWGWYHPRYLGAPVYIYPRRPVYMVPRHAARAPWRGGRR